MSTRPMLAAALALLALPAAAAEVRYYVQDGVTYRETRQVIQRPMTEMRMQSSTQTIYREELSTEYRDTVRTWCTPVTEYRWEPTWVGRWNPFVEPYLEYRLVPRTCWQQSSETVKTPVASRRLVPETRTVEVPVSTQRWVSEELISRVPVGPSQSTLAGQPALLPQSAADQSAAPKAIGGIARLESDPPRQGAADGGWRASTTLR